MSAFEWFAIILISLGIAVPSVFAFVFMASNRINDAKVYLAISISSLFSFAVVATFGIIIAQGLNRLSLASGLLNWLGGATVGEIAGMLYIIIRFYFEKRRP